MSTLQEKTYTRIKSELKKNPDETVASIAKRLKLYPAYYYKHRAKLETKKPAAVKYRKFKTEAPTATPINGQLMLVMGSAEQLKQFVGGVL